MKQPWSSILGESLCGFGVALPVVWLVSYLWLTLLIFLNKCGLNVPLCEQGTVVLFTKLSGFFPKFLFSIMVVILAPIMEELIFRGGLYRAFRSNLSRRSAAILTSAIFATLHFNLVSLLPLYVLSFLLIKSYDRFGSVLIPISIHAAFNCNSLLLILLFKAQI
ncbi:MAG: CPBP family intramembrane metalloprotease, partial [Puniceicoccales bacterium]|jgi:membrane protease YdiL (CAAX protease family)|nr:CPBP family intramembrane metalloprotease [Puniceicoccales bacterium]